MRELYLDHVVTNTARITIDFTERARDNSKQVSNELGLTQKDLINITMENIQASSVKALAANFLARRDAERRKDKEIRVRLDKLDPQALEHLLAQLEARNGK